MKKLRGIIVPMLTPMETPDVPDYASTEKLVDHVIRGGVNGIFVLGSTGEGPALGFKEQKRMIECVVRVANKRVPVLAGISSASAVDSLKLGKHAVKAGADAVVAAPPCYLPAELDEELVNYYKRIASEVDLPLYLYNMPGLVKVRMSVDLIERLVGEVPNVAGYKDSTGDMAAFRETMKRIGGRDDLSILIGPEACTLEALRLGGDGGVNGGANYRPELFARLFRTFSEGDTAGQEQAQKEILELQKLYSDSPTTPKVVRALKHELAKQGLLKEVLAFPSLPA